MLLLLLVMMAGAVVALALGFAGRRRVGWVQLVAEMVMLVVMADVHLPGLGLVPAPFWALLLGGCAMTTALLDRLRRGGVRAGGDHLHALGMLLGAGFVLLAGHVPGGASGRGHDHGAVLLAPVAIAVAVHVGVVLWSVVGRRISRSESARRVAALVSVLAMGAMVVVH